MLFNNQNTACETMNHTINTSWYCLHLVPLSKLI
ncbi:unnamed protein product [Brassica oleracea var. botrytis]